MAYIPRSSFIPKEASGAIPQRIQKKTTIRIFNVAATLLFLASLIAAGGSFFYEDYSSKKLEAAKEKLEALGKENEGDEEKMDQLRAYDSKLRMAKGVLDAHIAPTRVFSIIEDFTKTTVQFSDFSFEYKPGFEATVSLSGKTDAFSSVVLQKMQLHKDSIFSELMVQGIGTSKSVAVGEEGKSVAAESSEEEAVTFEVTGVFVDDTLAYEGDKIELVKPATAPQVEVTEEQRTADEPRNAVTQ